MDRFGIGDFVGIGIVCAGVGEGAFCCVGIGRVCAGVGEGALCGVDFVACVGFCGVDFVACVGGDKLRLLDDRVDRLPVGGRFQ